MVTLEKDSWMARTYGTTELETNSIHHQCVEKIGDGLRIVGRASDGTIEAIESTTDWFAIGTQWHPELVTDPAILFGAFVQQVIDAGEVKGASSKCKRS